MITNGNNYHDGAGIYNHVHNTQELGIHQYIVSGNCKEGNNEPQYAVHGITAYHHHGVRTAMPVHVRIRIVFEMLITAR